MRWARVTWLRAERLANEHHEKTVQYLLALINQGKRQPLGLRLQLKPVVQA